jgi:hypothetical protein
VISVRSQVALLFFARSFVVLAIWFFPAPISAAQVFATETFDFPAAGPPPTVIYRFPLAAKFSHDQPLVRPVRSPRQTPSAPSSCRLFSISSGVALRLGLGTDFQPPPVFPLVCAPCLLQLKFGLALVDSFSARSFGRADQDSFADSTVQDFVFIFVRVVRLPIHICGQGFGCCWDFPFLKVARPSASFSCACRAQLLTCR